MSDQTIKLTCLVENTACGRGLLGEHGLSFLLQTPNGDVLFDTGQGLVLEHNSKQWGVDWNKVRAIALSHGHYDHTGGLAFAAQQAPQAMIYAHPQAWEPCYAMNAAGQSRTVAMPDGILAHRKQWHERILAVEQPQEILSGISLTGPIPRETSFETSSGDFFLDPQGKTRDSLIDDQALFFNSPRGTVVVLGCAHAGLINTLRYVRKLTESKPIHLAIGGTHLINANPGQIAASITALKKMNVGHITVGHCTGMWALNKLWQGLPGRCSPIEMGKTLSFEAEKQI